MNTLNIIISLCIIVLFLIIRYYLNIVKNICKCNKNDANKNESKNDQIEKSVEKPIEKPIEKLLKITNIVMLLIGFMYFVVGGFLNEHVSPFLIVILSLLIMVFGCINLFILMILTFQQQISNCTCVKQKFIHKLLLILGIISTPVYLLLLLLILIYSYGYISFIINYFYNYLRNYIF
jgi:hypothetical protein